VGGGLIGIELAEMLRSAISCHFLSTRKKFWDGVLPFGQMINRHILEHHIDLRLETNLVEIISDEKDMPKQSSPIKARLLIKIGLTAGVSPC
jgi:NADPH-dependent 2,4-dienoyl-CoA reductase/sulfur reductase-like enzyme